MRTILYFLEPRESVSMTVCNIMEGMIRRYGIEPSSYDTKKGIIEFPFVRVLVYYANSSNLAGLRADEIFGHYPDNLREVVLKNPDGARFIGEFYEYLHLLSIDYRKLEGKKFKIKKVIFNPPATIVLWEDGTKTVVKAQNDDEFDAEKGLAMAISKKALGNKGNYCNEIKKWTNEHMRIHKKKKVLFKDLGTPVEFEFTIAPDTITALKTLGDSSDNTFEVSAVVDEIRRWNEELKPNPVQKAYDILVAFRDKDRCYDLDEVIGYLGEALED